MLVKTIVDDILNYLHRAFILEALPDVRKLDDETVHGKPKVRKTTLPLKFSTTRFSLTIIVSLSVVTALCNLYYSFGR